MLERLVSFVPINQQEETVEITLRGTEPYLTEMEGYNFVPLVALFKAPNEELARKFWNLSKIDKIEFAVQVSRMLDRIFLNEEKPYVSAFFANRLGEEEPNFYSQRQTSFRNTMEAIRHDTENNDYEILDWNEYRSYIIILNGERLLFSVHINEPNTFIFYDGLEGASNTVDDRILFQATLSLRILTREEFNSILPDIDFAIMKLLHLRFDLSQQGRDLLNLALTNTFTIKQRKPGKISIDELEALENNEYNIYNKDAYRAISALAIVGANQSGRTYFSGFEDPVAILRRQRQLHEELRR